jgi:hypothetical protein
MEEDGELVGVVIFYDGAKARELNALPPRSRAIPTIPSLRKRKRRSERVRLFLAKSRNPLNTRHAVRKAERR